MSRRSLSQTMLLLLLISSSLHGEWLSTRGRTRYFRPSGRLMAQCTSSGCLDGGMQWPDTLAAGQLSGIHPSLEAPSRLTYSPSHNHSLRQASQCDFNCQQTGRLTLVLNGRPCSIDSGSTNYELVLSTPDGTEIIRIHVHEADVSQQPQNSSADSPPVLPPLSRRSQSSRIPSPRFGLDALGARTAAA